MILNQTNIMFIAYIIIMLIVGFIAYYYTNNFSDYILGGRKLGSFVTAMSAGASDMSAWLLMAVPASVYFSGLSQCWVVIGLTIGTYLNWSLVSKRLRVFTECNGNSLTLSEYLYHRFGSNNQLLKIIPAIIILLFFTIYCASGTIAGARLFENLFNMDYFKAIWIGSIVTIIYTFIGGFIAVSWTDTIQAILIVFAIITVPIVTIIESGGLQNSLLAIEHTSMLLQKDLSYMFNNVSIITIISLLSWGLGYFGQPHILTRFMAADNVNSLKKAKKIGMFWVILCFLGATCVGYFGIAFFSIHNNLATEVNKNNEQIFIELTHILFNPWIAGIMLSAILAAIMSSLSCQLLICSSSITEDLYKGLIKPNASQKELIWIGRIMVLFIAMIAIFIAYRPENKILKLVSFAWSGFGSAFGPVVLMSLFWKKMSPKSAIFGMIVGSLVVLSWNFIFPNSKVLEIIPGFIITTITIIIVSLLDNKFDSKIQDKFEESKNLYLNLFKK